MTSYLRPDEKATMADIERSKSHDDLIKSGVKTAIGFAAGAVGGGPALKAVGSLGSKIIPFINKYIPTDMAIKGISKVSPEIGRLLQKGMNHGLNIQDGLDFLKDEIGKNSKTAKQNLNIIEQESPELHKFLDQEILKGRKPIEAAAIAQNDKKFSSIINKLMKSHKTPWSSIVESIFGSGEMALPQQSGDSGQVQQPMQQGNPQAKQQLLQAMQSLSQKLRT